MTPDRADLSSLERALLAELHSRRQNHTSPGTEKSADLVFHIDQSVSPSRLRTKHVRFARGKATKLPVKLLRSLQSKNLVHRVGGQGHPEVSFDEHYCLTRKGQSLARELYSDNPDVCLKDHLA